MSLTATVAGAGGHPARRLGGVQEMVGWLLLEKVIRFGVGFFVGAAVARHLGPADFGTLNRGLAFAALFGCFTGLGLDTILKRDLVAEPARRSALLATVFALRLGSAAIGLGAVMVCSMVWLPEPRDRTIAVVAALPFFAAPPAVFDLDLHASLRGRLAASCQMAGTVVAAASRVLLIVLQASLVWFAVAMVVEAVVVSVSLAMADPQTTRSLRWRSVDLRLGGRLLGESWPLILSATAVAIYLRIDQVMLAAIRGAEETGVYVAAVRLAELGSPVAVVVGSALLPGLVRAGGKGTEFFAREAAACFEAATLVAFLIVVAGTALAPWIVPLCFGGAYRDSVPVLMVLVWSNLFVFSGVVRSQVLTARGATVFLMLATVLGAVLNVLCNLWWIPAHGAIGAAWATIVSYAAAAWLSTLVWPATRDAGAWQTRAMLMPWRGVAAVWRFVRT